MGMICEFCGNEFKLLRKDQKYCSKVCGQKARSLINNSKAIRTEKECVFCKKNFFPTIDSRQIYCSKKCNSLAYKAKYREKVKNNHTITSMYRLFERDGFRCAYCGKTSYEDGIKLVADHIYPSSKGGDPDLFNAITACEPCNLSKYDRVLAEDKMMDLWRIAKERNTLLSPKTYSELKEIFEKLEVKRRAKR